MVEVLLLELPLIHSKLMRPGAQRVDSDSTKSTMKTGNMLDPVRKSEKSNASKRWLKFPAVFVSRHRTVREVEQVDTLFGRLLSLICSCMEKPVSFSNKTGGWINSPYSVRGDLEHATGIT